MVMLPRKYAEVGAMKIGNQIVFVTDNEYRNVFNIATFGDLISNYSNILERFQIR